MKKIGKQVLFLATNDKVSRNGEGAFIRLKDGRIMYALTEFISGDWTDHSDAQIVAYFSSDEGETWGDKRILLKKEENELNIMSVSLIRLNNGDLGLIYLIKTENNDALCCTPYIRRSKDEGLSFSKKTLCLKEFESSIFVLNNDRVLKTSTGRIILPFAKHVQKKVGSGYEVHAGHVIFSYSDDDGKTWDYLPTELYSDYNDLTQFQEPGMFELPDGKLWTYIRTSYGFQYQSFSDDNGQTWTKPVPNFYFTSPEAPMLIKKMGDYTVAVFNPLPYSCVSNSMEVWGSAKRTPYVIAISKNGGYDLVCKDVVSNNGWFKDFNERVFLLEDDYTNSYCYPALIEVEGGFLVSYYHSNNTPIALNSAKITKVLFSEFED